MTFVPAHVLLVSTLVKNGKSFFFEGKNKTKQKLKSNRPEGTLHKVMNNNEKLFFFYLKLVFKKICQYNKTNALTYGDMECC